MNSIKITKNQQTDGNTLHHHPNSPTHLSPEPAKLDSNEKGKQRANTLKGFDDSLSDDEQSTVHPKHSTNDSSNNKQASDDLDEPPHCAICLSPVDNKAIITPCHHADFCFACIRPWTDQSRRCPLCLGNIQSLLYNIRSDKDFQTYHLQALSITSGASSSASLFSSTGPSSSGRNGVPSSRYTSIPRHAFYGRQRDDTETWRETLEERAIERRRYIYREGLYAKHVASNRYTGFKPFTPEQISKNPNLKARLVKFIRRELQVFPHVDIAFLTTYLLSIAEQLDLRSASAIRLIADFLSETDAEHLVHEIVTFIRSPFNTLDGYDRMIQYGRPARSDPVSPPHPPPRPTSQKKQPPKHNNSHRIRSSHSSRPSGPPPRPAPIDSRKSSTPLAPDDRDGWAPTTRGRPRRNSSPQRDRWAKERDRSKTRSKSRSPSRDRTSGRRRRDSDHPARSARLSRSSSRSVSPRRDDKINAGSQSISSSHSGRRADSPLGEGSIEVGRQRARSHTPVLSNETASAQAESTLSDIKALNLPPPPAVKKRKLLNDPDESDAISLHAHESDQDGPAVFSIFGAAKRKATPAEVEKAREIQEETASAAEARKRTQLLSRFGDPTRLQHADSSSSLVSAATSAVSGGASTSSTATELRAKLQARLTAEYRASSKAATMKNQLYKRLKAAKEEAASRMDADGDWTPAFYDEDEGDQADLEEENGGGLGTRKGRWKEGRDEDEPTTFSTEIRNLLLLRLEEEKRKLGEQRNGERGGEESLDTKEAALRAALARRRLSAATKANASQSLASRVGAGVGEEEMERELMLKKKLKLKMRVKGEASAVV